MLPSANYVEWHEEMSKWFMINKRKWGVPAEPIKSCVISIYITFPDNLKSDLTNKAESIMDLLVDLGVLEDDNHFVCHTLLLHSRGVDKSNPHALVDISYN